MKNRPLILILLALVCLPAFAERVDFSLPDMDDRQRSLSEFRGKWVLVNYWATWCPPCLAEMPDLEKFHLRHKDNDAVVIGVNLENIDVDRLKAFVKKQPVSYPMLRGKPATKTELGSVPALPTSYLISPLGEVAARQVGTVNSEMVEGFIEKFRQGK